MKKKAEIVVIAHDAGGAEVLAAYVREHRATTRFMSYVAGPAARIWKREHLRFSRMPASSTGITRVVRGHRNANMVLLGTGWMTHIESDALAEAKKQNIRTAVYLESWSRYRERFGYPHIGWQKKLPDEVWVGDRYAYKIAARQFPKTVKVRFVPNEYFAETVRKYRMHKSRKKPDSILFLSSIDNTTQRVFEALLRSMEQKTGKRVRVRFHPADDRSRFDGIIKRCKRVTVEKSHEQDITKDLLRASVVIGTETTAMAVAALAGIQVVSLLPMGVRSTLPFSGIIRTRSPKVAVRLLAKHVKDR